ncbi:MAG: hypothetical protein LKM33_00210 [Bacteroidales bacterium]|nr:hypothetical protein [Bacteroidales bacterium]
MDTLDIKNDTAIVFLNLSFKNRVYVYDKPNGKILKSIKQDSANEDYLMFMLLKREKNMFFVRAYSSLDGRKIIDGWIDKNYPLGIYSSVYNNDFKLMSCRDLKYDQFNGTLKCAYTYLADGTKVMVQDNASSSASNGYLYLGSMVFKKTGTGYAFESTDFGGGRIINVNGTLSPYYYATDHLGSVRAITDASGNVTERNDYYAFGKRMTTGGSYPVMTSNRWKYNGKEVQTTGNVNWLDYGAREYDEVIARWTRPDPMSEKYYGTSGYTYCVDIPVIFCDPTGKTIWIYYDDNEGKKKKMRYLAGMAYSGNNNFVSSSINILNAMNGVKAGAKVLSSLTSSKYDYDFWLLITYMTASTRRAVEKYMLQVC